MPVFLRDILDHKRQRHDADADLFRAVVQYEFAAGLNATAEGAAAAMRRWVAQRPTWISDVQQARRVAALAVIETALSPQPAPALAAMTMPALTAALQRLSDTKSGRPRRLASLPGESDAAPGEGTWPDAKEDHPRPLPELKVVRTVNDGSPLGPRYTVLVGGGYYLVNKYLLASLEAGMAPHQLDLEPVEEDE